MSTELDPILTEAEAAEYLRLTPKALQKRRWAKRPPLYVKIDGTVRYRASDLRDYLENNLVQPKHTEAANANV